MMTDDEEIFSEEGQTDLISRFLWVGIDGWLIIEWTFLFLF